MKKICILFGMITLFLSGLTLGGDFSKGASNFFEEAKDNFEEQISAPNGNYQNFDLVPNEYLINKTAHKLEDFITNKIKSLFSKLS